MKKKKLILIITFSIIGVLFMTTALTAIIYHSVKHNRYSGYVYESGTNKPLEGVAVTNGRDVVKTDKNGYYCIDGWLKDRFVTVSIPDGYWTDDFYLDVGKSREGYNFYLDKRSQDMTNHTFLQISDTEVGEGGVGDWINDVKQKVEETNPAFLIHTGDICYEAGLKSHIKGMNSETMGVPVRYVIGNHDYVKGKYGEELYESIYGPVCYSFDVGNIHYVVTPIVNGDYWARYTRSDVWRWLANDLKNMKKGQKVVMFNHDFCPDENGFEVRYGLNKLDIKDYGLKAWIFGHWHYNYMYETADGVFNICTSRPDCGGIDSGLAGVRRIDIEGGELKQSEMLYLGNNEMQESEGEEWKTQLEGNAEFAEPVIVGDRMCVATTDDGYPKKCGVYCLDAKTGEIIWKYSTGNSVRNSFAIAQEKLVAQDITGKVYCIDIKDGKEIWTKNNNLYNATNTSYGVTIDGDKIYCGGAQKIVCRSLTDGKVIWENSYKSGNSSPTRITVADNNIIVGMHWDKLIAFNKSSGRKVWTNDKDGLRYRTTTPLIYDEKMYIAAQNTVFIMNPYNGKVYKKQSFDYNFDTATSPLISDGIGYFATADKGVVAIDLNTMELKWNYVTGKNIVCTSPYVGKSNSTVESSVVLKNNLLYFGASDGYIHCVDKQGNLVKKYNAGAPVLSQVAIYGDSLIAAGFDGRIVSFDLA